MATLKYSEFYEAFLTFLIRNCVPMLPGGGEVGEHNPQYVHTEIRLVLTESGAGYIHTLGQDSDTVEFMTMDHFRSQGMITPEQRDKINKLTVAKASKIVRDRNNDLEKENKELKNKLNSIVQITNSNSNDR